jgi:sodium transport system permease protein
MTRSEALLIYKKELKVILRDRRTLVLAFLLPVVIYPFLIFGMEKLQALGAKKLEERRAVVAVAEPEPWVAPALAGDRKFSVRTDLDEAGAKKAVEAKEVQVFLKVEAPQGKPKLVTIYYDSANEFSQHTEQPVEEALKAFKKKVVAVAFRSHGYEGDLEKIVQVSEVNLATEKQMGGFYLGRLIPFILVMLVLTGASISAVDLLAGEKERGTLETLLSSSISRSSIIVGKFFVVLTTALLSALLNLGSLGFYFSLGIFDLPMKGKVAIPMAAVFYALPLVLPLAVLASAALLLISGYAKSFKEGQIYFLPFMLFCMVLSYVSLLPGVELQSVLSLVPIANVALAVREIFVGKFAWPYLLLVFGTTSLYAGLLLWKTIPLLNREDILIPHEAEPTLGAASAHQLARRGFVFFVLVWLLMYYGGSRVQEWNLLKGLAITEYLLILLPSVLFARRIGVPVREAFNLRLPRNPAAWPATVLLGVATPFLALGVVALQNRFLPVPRSVEELFTQAFDVRALSPFLTLFLFSVSPAICEEVIFRGVLTHMLRKRYGKFWLVVVVGVLFGLFHFSVYRFLPTTLIGILLTFLLVRTDSIFPCMLLHATNNAVGIFLLQDLDPSALPIGFFVGIAVLFLVGLGLLLKGAPGRRVTA